MHAPGDTVGYLEDAARRFALRWQQEGGADLGDFVPRLGHPFRVAALVQLVKADQRERWHRGEPKPLEAYLSEWPELGTSPTIVGDLLTAECLLLARQDRLPSDEELRRRFSAEICALVNLQIVAEDAEQSQPQCDVGEAATTETHSRNDIGSTAPFQRQSVPVRRRCPRCRQPVEIGDDCADAEVACASCGNRCYRDELLNDTAETERGLPQQCVARFRLIEQLGAGAFGVVWKAHDPKLDRYVAVKLPRRHLDPSDAETFFREARAAAQLRHPHIVGVHEAGQDGSVFYIVSDLIVGESLDRYLARHRPTEREAAQLCQAIAAALHFAHQHGVVHRDLKPSNVMIGTDGVPHVMDFGLARREAGEATKTVDGQVLGTPAYMSPEQARGEGHRADGRADVYSLGVILFELLSGRRPFRGHGQRLLKQVIENEPPRVRRFNTRVSRDLETVCAKCLEKAPQQRYDTAAELADDLGRFLAGEPIRARRVGGAERLWRWSRRQPLTASLVAAIAASVLLGAILSAYFGSQAVTYREDAAISSRLADVKASEADANAERAARKAKEVEEEREKAEHGRYLDAIGLAQKKWTAADIGGMRPVLMSCPERFRQWEWHYLRRLEYSDCRVFHGHQKVIASLAFSPDGTRLATASYDKTVKIWDATSGRELHTLRGHAGNVMSVSFSPDGARLATASWDKSIRLWDAATGREILVLPEKLELAQQAVFSPNGKWLIIANHEQVSVRDATDGRELRRVGRFSTGVPGLLGYAGASRVVFSPDSSRVATLSTSNTTPRIWNTTDWTLAAELRGHAEAAFGAAFSPDGKWLATGGRDKTVIVWDVAAGEPLRTLSGHTDEVRDVAFDRTGHYLATASLDRTVRIWDPTTGAEKRILRGHEDGVASVAFHPTRLQLATGSSDTTARIWSLQDGQEAIVLEGREDKSAKMATFNGMSKLLADALAGDSGRFHFSHAAFSPDGNQVVAAASDWTAKFYDLAGRRESRVLRKHAGVVASASFSPDGRWLVTASYDKTARIWDTATWQEVRTLRGHASLLRDACFSPDSRRLATASFDATVKIWNVADGEEAATLRGHGGWVTHISFSPDGSRLVSVGAAPARKPSVAIVWDTALWQETRTFGIPTGVIVAASFSPDGAWLATGCADGTARIWNVASGQEAKCFRGHTDAVLCLQFGPDGKRLATSSKDKSVRLWDVESERETIVLGSPAEPSWHICFSQDGHKLLAVQGETVKVWDATPLELAASATPPRGAPNVAPVSPADDRDAEARLAQVAAAAKRRQDDCAKKLGVPAVVSNQVGMKFALIPPGDFEMGVGGEGPATADPSILRCASPKRRVTITKPFYLGQTEVTIGQFRQFVQAASYRTTAELQGGSFVWKSKPRQRQLCPEFTWSSPGGEPNADDPVRHVSWNDAVAFCQWLARTEKVPCRLPTEAEWEYACRADSSVQFSFGVNERDLPRHAWFRDNSRGAPHPVGQKLSNAWQLFDMHGNVYEWCADWNTGPYSAASPVTDPVGEAQGVRRVIRGGAYDDAPARMYSTTRYGDTPAYRNEYTGFRVARTVEAMSAGK